jgi:hypothetical protein
MDGANLGVFMVMMMEILVNLAYITANSRWGSYDDGRETAFVLWQ